MGERVVLESRVGSWDPDREVVPPLVDVVLDSLCNGCHFVFLFGSTNFRTFYDYLKIVTIGHSREVKSVSELGGYVFHSWFWSVFSKLTSWITDRYLSHSQTNW